MTTEMARRQVYTCYMEYGELGEARTELCEMLDTLVVWEEACIELSRGEEAAAAEQLERKLVTLVRAMPHPEVTQEVTADIVGRCSNASLLKFRPKYEGGVDLGRGLHISYCAPGWLQARLLRFSDRGEISTLLERYVQV